MCSHSLVQMQLGAGAEGERGVMARSSSGGAMCCRGLAGCWVGDGILVGGVEGMRYGMNLELLV